MKGRLNIDSAKLIASYLFSLSLFALAASIVYFTYEMALVSKQIPDVLTSIDYTSNQIEPTLNEIAVITEQVPALLEEIKGIRRLIPPILAEVEQTRKQIPAIIDEVEQMRKQIPAILDEVAAVRSEMPAVLSSADKATDSVVLISKEITSTRESIPQMMDRADVLIEKARVAGKEASQGAVTGIFKGIITAPFVLIGDAGRSIAGIPEEDAKDYSARDYDLIEEASLDLLNNGSEGDVRKWDNTESGHYGVITLTQITEDDSFDNECRILNIELFDVENDGDSESDKKDVSRTLCRNDDEQWEIDE